MIFALLGRVPCIFFGDNCDVGGVRLFGSAAVGHLLQQVALWYYSIFWAAVPGCLSLGWVNVGGPGPVGPTGGFGLEG